MQGSSQQPGLTCLTPACDAGSERPLLSAWEPRTVDCLAATAMGLCSTEAWASGSAEIGGGREGKQAQQFPLGPEDEYLVKRYIF